MIVHMPSLPSLVTIATLPVSATRKLPPLMPMSADRKCKRSTCRASAVRSVISVLRGVPCTRVNRSEISSLSLWITGAMMCDGASLSLICRMYSPRSVSTGVMPAADSAALRPTSSDTIDFDLVALRTPWRRPISTIRRAASSWVCA